MIDDPAFVGFFRHAAPYVHAHRGRTFVVAFAGEAVESPGFSDLINDLAVLQALGVRLVLVHGARPQVEARLTERGVDRPAVGDRRITDADALEAVKAAVGAVRVEIEGRLSMGLASSPMANARLRVAVGNFVYARPVGIVDGVNHQHTGEVRRIDAEGIQQRLDAGAMVLISPLGYSITGEVFNLRYAEVACAVAGALAADKLIMLVEAADPPDHLPRQVDLDAADALRQGELPPDLRQDLEAAVTAGHAGVRRAHLIDRRRDGALLSELFTRDGVGTLVTAESYEGIRRARSTDVGGLLTLIRPLADLGILVDRPRDLLERAIQDFWVVERDGMVVACAALHPHPGSAIGELACVAVHPDYRHERRGAQLLEVIERKAREAGLARLFVLTTRSAHWFRERGFEPGEVQDLPPARQATYDPRRNSQVLVKSL